MTTCARDGCPHEVSPGCTWCSQACIPTELRVAWARQNRLEAAQRFRLRRFREYFKQLAGRSVTWEDLVAVIEKERLLAYHAGYRASEVKWRRLQEQASTATREGA